MRSLFIQAPNKWILGEGAALGVWAFSGSQPLAGRTLLLPTSRIASTLDGSGVGSRILLDFDSDLMSGVTQGSGGSFTLAAASSIFDPSVISITDLRLHWGVNDGQSGQPFGTFQSNAIPEPSAYAALLGLAALGCVALRRRVR